MLSDHPPVTASLHEELIGWLTTVNEAGQPQASAVWHVIDGDELVVFSRIDATKLANIRSNPRVAFNLRGDLRGDTIVTMEGTARIDPSPPKPSEVPAYLSKYASEMERLGWTPEGYDREFPTAVRITITRVRAW